MCEMWRLPGKLPGVHRISARAGRCPRQSGPGPAYSENDIDLDDQTYLAMSKCLLCGSCVEKCPNEVPTDEIVVAAREALAKRRGLTTFHAAVGQVIKNRSLMKMGARMASLLGPLFFRKVPETSGLRLAVSDAFCGRQTPYPGHCQKPFMDRHPEVIPGEPGKPRIVFFVGCMTNFVYTDIGEAALALFRHLGCTVIIPKGPAVLRSAGHVRR